MDFYGFLENIRQEAPPVPAIELSRGDICCIDGLKEANGLNGVTCTLWRQDPESLRWEVKLPDGEAAHLLHPFRAISLSDSPFLLARVRASGVRRLRVDDSYFVFMF